MKTIAILIISLLCIIGAKAADNDDIGRITIQAYVPETESLPNESAKLLQTKLSQIITNNGIADNEYCERFVLTAKVNIITKDIVAGPPQRISQKMDITLSIGDIKEDKVFSSLTMTTVGIGTSLEKSYISAFKNVRPDNPRIKEFMEDGKNKILAYYEANCPAMMAEAKSLANQQQYGEALLILTSIPDVCKDCYEQSCNLQSSIYVDMINTLGASLLKQAQSAWAEQPNRDGAERAMSFISQINADADCMAQVNKLTEEITKKLIADDKREWQLKLEQYRDDQKREAEERAYAQQRYAEQQKTNRTYIRACRDAAVAYYKNRPKVVNNYYTRVLLW